MKKIYLLKDIDDFNAVLKKEEMVFFKRKTKFIDIEIKLSDVIKFINEYLFLYKKEDYDLIISICKKIENFIGSPDNQTEVQFFEMGNKRRIKKFNSDITLRELKNWIIKNDLDIKKIKFKIQ